jgi:hypothetical protein
MMSRKLIFATLVMLFSNFAMAMDLDYPELQVVPSAEDRLQDAVKHEKDSGFIMRNWQLLTPATALILSGSTLKGDYDVSYIGDINQRADEEDEIEMTANLQILAGLAWWGLTYYVDRSSYGTELSRIQKMPKNSKRSRLVRARYAEEALLHKYKTMKKMKWFLLGTTIALSQMSTNDAGEKAKAFAGLAAMSAFVPVFFKHQHETNYLNYERYKNRIYGPVASLGFVPTGDRKSLAPAVSLRLDF